MGIVFMGIIGMVQESHR